ncbi:hypothetical protein CH92_11665 [Stutzerimonas stutzeri]|uniref:TonB-dependent receptor n=2 Tax=Stutzerimonas stutzeri TaxID=316 RepID=W8QYK1_STUST|nr:hypothetical protein CH92_11665 [Stutzerimonas stutzeri]
MTVTANADNPLRKAVQRGVVLVEGEAVERPGEHAPGLLEQRVPGLVLSGHNARFAGIGLRGYGATAFNDGLEGSVGVFVDGVYLGRQGMALGDWLDIDRIEVLRGPQNTAFGKNSSAGALNIVTRQPSSEFEARGETSVGSQGLRQYRGSISGPLQNGVLAGRLSAFQTERDALVENHYNGASLNDKNEQGLRGQLLWTPNDVFSARLVGEYGKQDESGNALMASHYSDQTRRRAAFVGYDLPVTDPKQGEVQHDAPTSSRVSQDAVSLELNWALAPTMRLTSISAHRDWAYVDKRDGDSTPLKVAESNVDLQHRQFSQELRLSGSAGKRLDYSLGIYYLTQRSQRETDVRFGDEAAAWFIGDRLDEIEQLFGIRFNDPAQIPKSLLDGAQQQFAGAQESDSRAIFGQLAWRPLERIELTGGLRYGRERKQGWMSREVVDLASLDSLPAVIQGGGQLLRQIALGDVYYRRDSIKERHLTGQLGFSYQFSDAVTGRVGWSRGYRTGGINFDVVGPTAAPTFDSERATSLEVGLESRFWNDRARVDLTLYQTDIDNYQALTYSPPATLFAPPLRDNLINVGEVRLRGIELDSAWRLHSRTSLRLGVAWSDARYGAFRNAPCPPGEGQWVCDLSGKRLYNAPEWNVSTGLDYWQPLVPGLEGFGGIDYSFRSGYYGTLEGGKGSYQPSYGLTHLRFGMRRSDHGWEVEGCVRNLFDRHSVTAVYALLGAGDYGVLTGEPRMAGVTVRARY